MVLTRRRFLSISAACAVAPPATAQTRRWKGRALGAEVEITLVGPDAVVLPALTKAHAALSRVEAQFNLFDPISALSVLNQNGRLRDPDPLFIDLVQRADQIHVATGGLFDPTVQPLWRAYAEARDPSAALELIGWSRVQANPKDIVLGAGQALTFNGIAQGYATDLVADTLAKSGLSQTLVNIGEFRGMGGPWRLGISDPVLGLIGTRTLHAGAIATSSPDAVPLGGQGHILHARARPLWSTVSVEAADATTADGFSTALTMAPLDVIRSVVGSHGVRHITLVSRDGDVTSVAA